MKHPILRMVIAGLSFGIPTYAFSQTNDSIPPAKPDPPGENHGTKPCKAPSDTGATGNHDFFSNVRWTGGQLTVPFKIRNKPENGTFRLSTDVTLGAYFGITKPLPGKGDNSITIPITAGLTFINLNNDNTTIDPALRTDDTTDVVPGLTWSSGILLQLDHYNLGIIVGKDYASEVGNQWIYHRKWWWSFGLGFSFTK